MFATERIKKIKSILLEYKKANVSNLSQFFSVSEVTIRKDLELLENEGFVKRLYGGAILCENDTPENIYENSLDIPEIEHKKMIGLIAAQTVNNGEAIFIGAGTTCLQIAKNLKDKKNLNVITNSISVSVELLNIPDIRVVLTGGELKQQKYTYCLTGPAVIQSIQNTYVDKAFISVNGISFKRGYTMHDSDDLTIALEVLKFTKELVIVADSSKFDKISFSQLGELNLAKKVISNELAPAEYMAYYFSNKIQMFTTYKLQ